MRNQPTLEEAAMKRHNKAAKKQTKAKSLDALVKASKKTGATFSEAELKKVSGGTKENKINF
jgi:hypothetical protein